eukprot:scaffold275540_cov17-Tisochrysis_lutea.AAC.1
MKASRGDKGRNATITDRKGQAAITPSIRRQFDTGRVEGSRPATGAAEAEETTSETGDADEARQRPFGYERI